jgi:diguanylate cyclase (GGDEF)-like protein
VEGAENTRHLLERAEELGGTGSWVWYETEQRSEWSPNALKILGLEPGEERWLFDLVHPDDRSIRTFDTFVTATMPLTIEYRIVRRSDGEELWLRETGLAELGPDGSLFAVYGTIADITELRATLARERDQTAILDAIFAAAPIGIVLYDRELRYLRVNETYALWSGKPVSDHVGLRVDDVFPGFGAVLEPMVSEVMSSGVPLVGVEATVGGRWYRSSRYPVRAVDGEVVAVANIVDDISELKRLEALLAEQARTDALTGLANRRHFAEELHQASARARRHGAALAVLLLDLDGFKAVNDTRGHAAGDELLQAAAAVMQSQAREVDVPARLGGDEFVLLVGDLEPASARAAADAIARRLRDCLQQRGISSSIGVATSAELDPGLAHDARADALLAAADQAMYRAKRERRRAR